MQFTWRLAAAGGTFSALLDQRAEEPRRASDKTRRVAKSSLPTRVMPIPSGVPGVAGRRSLHAFAPDAGHATALAVEWTPTDGDAARH